LQEAYKRARRVGGFVNLRDKVKRHLTTTIAKKRLRKGFTNWLFGQNRLTLDAANEITPATLVEGEASPPLKLMESKP
jgi:hypothetical protein